jgi:hypothetical protein
MTRLTLSKDQDYLAHGQCFATCDYGAATSHLRKVLARAKAGGGDAEQVGYLIFSIGKMKYLSGDARGAKRSFLKAKNDSGDSAVVSLLIAKFYLEFTKDNSSGIKWLKNVLEVSETSEARFSGRWRKEAKVLLERVSANSSGRD